MRAEVRQRLKWIRMCEASADAGLVCRRCGISRPTLRRWLRRYGALGVDGLESHSRRPHTSPGQKVKEEDRQLILQLRRLGLGARRIRGEPRLHHAACQRKGAAVEPAAPPEGADLETRVEQWQSAYNWRRSHGGLKGKTPADRLAELVEKTPLREDVAPSL